MKKIYDTENQGTTIRSWMNQGLLCREGETYKDIYYHVMSIDNCELCNVGLIEGVKTNSRCMDHDHNTGYFRMVLCRRCNSGFDRPIPKVIKIKKNNKMGHMWISRNIKKTKIGDIRVVFRYSRKGFRGKISSLTKLIALSFINILKKPI